MLRARIPRKRKPYLLIMRTGISRKEKNRQTKNENKTKNTHTKKTKEVAGDSGTTQLTLVWINLRLKVIRDYYRKFRKPRKD